MSPTVNQGTLDRILDVASKIQQIASIVAPGAGGAAGLGVTLVKFFADQWNQAHADQPVTLPSDAVLIQRLADTAARIVSTGQAFLEE